MPRMQRSENERTLVVLFVRRLSFGRRPSGAPGRFSSSSRSQFCVSACMREWGENQGEKVVTKNGPLRVVGVLGGGGLRSWA